MMRAARVLILTTLVLALPRPVDAQTPGFLETFNGKTKGMLVNEGWEFFPNSGFSISTIDPYDAQYVRANAGEGQVEFLATPCVDFDSDLDTVSFWYRSYGVVTGIFSLGWQSAFDPIGVNVLWLDTVGITNTWTYLEAYYNPPDTPDVCRLVFGMATQSTGGGKLGIDHFWSRQAMLVYNCCDSFITCDSLLLPVQALELSGKELNGTVVLDWSCAAEYGVAGYSIERSAGADIFEEVGHVAATGTSGGQVAYHFTDYIPIPLAYYRLCVIDNDGNRKYSDIITVQTTIDHPMAIYPNPIGGSGFVIIPKIASDEYELRIYDVVGGLVYSKNILTSGSGAALKFELPTSLSDDIYMLQFCSEGHCEYQRVSVAR
jgi:hypothetical protein